MNFLLSWCGLFVLVLASNPALATEVTQLQTQFEAGRHIAIAYVLQSSQSDAPETNEVATWLRTHSRALAEDLAASRLVWVAKMPEQCPPQRCACTLPLPRSDIWLSESLCDTTTLDQSAVVRLLVHEGAHHLAIVDEAFADGVAAVAGQGSEQVTAVAVRSRGNVTLEVAKSNHEVPNSAVATDDRRSAWVVESDFRSGATSGLNGPTSLGVNIGYQAGMRSVIMTARQGKTRVEWDQIDDPDYVIKDEFESWEPVLTARAFGLSGRQFFGSGRFYASGGVFEDTIAAKPRTSATEALTIKLLRFEFGLGCLLPIDDQVGALVSATGSVPLQQSIDERVAISEVHSPLAIAAGFSARL